MGRCIGTISQPSQCPLLTARTGHLDLEMLQQISHQFQSQQGVVQRQELLFELRAHGQQFAPAVGQPATVVPVVGRLDRQRANRRVITARLRLHAGQQLLQPAPHMRQVCWHGHRRVIRQPLRLANPQAVLELLAAGQAKTPTAVAADHHQPRLRTLQCDDVRQRADRLERFRLEGLAVGCLRATLTHLLPLRQAHHPEGRTLLVAAADQIEVAHLEDAQRQHAAGKQHRLQWKQR